MCTMSSISFSCSVVEYSFILHRHWISSPCWQGLILATYQYYCLHFVYFLQTQALNSFFFLTHYLAVFFFNMLWWDGVPDATWTHTKNTKTNKQTSDARNPWSSVRDSILMFWLLYVQFTLYSTAHTCACVCVHACVHACMCVCVCVRQMCVHACVRERLRGDHYCCMVLFGCWLNS